MADPTSSTCTSTPPRAGASSTAPLPPGAVRPVLLERDSTSVRSVLNVCGGFEPAAVEAFMTIHADRPFTMPLFLRILRTVDTPGTDFATTLSFDELSAITCAWHAILDHETIVLLAQH